LSEISNALCQAEGVLPRLFLAPQYDLLSPAKFAHVNFILDCSDFVHFKSGNPETSTGNGPKLHLHIHFCESMTDVLLPPKASLPTSTPFVKADAIETPSRPSADVGLFERAIALEISNAALLKHARHAPSTQSKPSVIYHLL
jgi:hypothetical protein